jgi:hypothetical protein
VLFRSNWRVNVLQSLFFLTRENQTWSGIGYVVDAPSRGAGTLYRYFASTRSDPAALLPPSFPNISTTNLSRIMDGVVHFRVRAFDTNGVWLKPPDGRAGMSIVRSPAVPEDYNYGFTNNAVPAFVELEIGILEDRTFQRYQSLVSAAAQYAYLSNHVGQVHLFRQRIPVRNVDYTAYQ